MTASVQLIEALGGGWNTTQLPSPKGMVSKTQPSQSHSAPNDAMRLPQFGGCTAEDRGGAEGEMGEGEGGEEDRLGGRDKKTAGILFFQS